MEFIDHCKGLSLPIAKNKAENDVFQSRVGNKINIWLGIQKDNEWAADDGREQTYWNWMMEPQNHDETHTFAQSSTV